MSYVSGCDFACSLIWRRARGRAPDGAARHRSAPTSGHLSASPARAPQTLAYCQRRAELSRAHHNPPSPMRRRGDQLRYLERDGSAPACIHWSDIGRRPLRSNSNDIRKLLVPRTHNELGDTSFSAAGPRLWNDLPPGLRRPGLTFDSFRQSLKTLLFGDRSA